MGTRLLNTVDEMVNGRNQFGFFEDFLDFVSGDLFTDTSADSGASVANVDAAGGAVTLTTGATDNNECYLLGTKEIFLFAADKPVVAECRLKYTEANTDDANVMFGLMNAVAANSLIDDAGGPQASFSGMGFYKIDGGVRWQAVSSLGTTRTTTDLTAALSLARKVATPGGGSYQTLRVAFLPTSSTEGEVTFFIDNELVAKHAITYTSATEMQAFVGVKAGGANSEVVTVDYIAAYALR